MTRPDRPIPFPDKPPMQPHDAKLLGSVSAVLSAILVLGSLALVYFSIDGSIH